MFFSRDTHNDRNKQWEWEAKCTSYKAYLTLVDSPICLIALLKRPERVDSGIVLVNGCNGK